MLHVTDVLKRSGEIDTRYFTEAQAWRGSQVHLACKFADECCLNRRKLAKGLRVYLTAWKLFRKNVGLERFLEIEKQVECQEYGYCGTPDRVFQRVAHWPCILDIKSTNGGALPHPSTRYQTAAYAYAWGKGRLMGRYAVVLKRDGTYNVVSYPVEDFWPDVRRFLRMLAEVKRGN